MSEPIRTPNPFRRLRRSRSSRRSVLRALPLNPIGDIATPSMTAGQGSLVWETATDWNNAVGEDAVVHDSFGDYPGSGTVQLGVPSIPSAELYSPMYENSGSTLSDVSGNSRDLSLNSGTLGTTAPVGTTGVDFGTSDSQYAESGSYNPFGSGEFTIGVFIYLQETFSSNNHWLFNQFASGSDRMGFFGNTNNSRGYLQISGTLYEANWSNEPSTNTWHLLAVRGDDNGTFDLWLDDTERASVSCGTLSNIGTSTTLFNTYSGNNFSNYSTDTKMWSGFTASKKLTNAELTSLYNSLSTGYLESATKSYAAPAKPDLQGLVYSLNGETIDLKVIGSPGTASEEVITQTLAGSSAYSLTWSNSHTDFRVRPEISTATPTTSPTISKVELFD